MWTLRANMAISLVWQSGKSGNSDRLTLSDTSPSDLTKIDEFT
jgi:hypothetical protein